MSETETISVVLAVAANANATTVRFHLASPLCGLSE